MNGDVRSKADNSAVVIRTYSNTTHADIVNASANTSDNSEIRIYTFYNVAAGNYTVKKGPDTQTSLVYIGVTYKTTSTFTIATAMSNDGGVCTVSGAGSYYPNDSVKLAVDLGAGKALTKWSSDGGTNDLGNNNPYYVYATSDATYTAVFEDAATKSINVESADDATGSAAASATTVAEGGSTSLTATAASEAYVFSNWTKSTDGSWSSTENPLVISYDDLSDGETYTANFKTLFTVTYDLGTYAGTTPKVLNNYDSENGINEKYASAADKYTIPSYAHRYLYREGYVLTGWTDGSNTYATGDEITLTGDITLSPTWTATTQTLANSASEVTVTWTFNRDQLLFNGWEGGTNLGYYTKPQTINGELIAVPMTVDARSGKVDNHTRATATQINIGTKLTIPATKGMTITINCSEDDVMTSENTLVGTDGMTVDGKVATYTYSGDASSIIIYMNAGRYYEKIAVTYPAMTVAKAISAAEYATFVPAEKVAVPSGVKAYIVTATSATTATLSAEGAITVIPANEPVIINGDAGTYYFPKTSAAPSSVTGNKLTTGAVTADGTQYILANGASGVGFYKANSGTTIAAGKAYLVSPSGAPFFLFSFGGETTAIDAVKSAKPVDGTVYNLAGQRVAQPTKGLYIVNGKKVVMK